MTDEFTNLPTDEKHARKKFKAYIHEIEMILTRDGTGKWMETLGTKRHPRIIYHYDPTKVSAKDLKRLNTIVKLINELEYVGKPRVEIER